MHYRTYGIDELEDLDERILTGNEGSSWCWDTEFTVRSGWNLAHIAAWFWISSTASLPLFQYMFSCSWCIPSAFVEYTARNVLQCPRADILSLAGRCASGPARVELKVARNKYVIDSADESCRKSLSRLYGTCHRASTNRARVPGGC